MRVVLDTNVLLSGLFFAGEPGRILDWWLGGGARLVVSPSILQEVERVFLRLQVRHPALPAAPLFQAVTQFALIVDAPDLPERVCRDPDDDKFLACALHGGTRWIVSGDADLLELDGWWGLRILKPADFVRHVIKQLPDDPPRPFSPTL